MFNGIVTVLRPEGPTSLILSEKVPSKINDNLAIGVFNVKLGNNLDLRNY